MKNARLLLGVILLCVTLGCRKNLNEIASSSDLNEPLQIQNSTENLGLLNAGAILASDWQSTNEWAKVDLPTHTVYHTYLKTSFVDNNPGQQIVRVFKIQPEKNPQLLPFEEIISGTRYYWYYTITKGNVMIAVDVYGSQKNPGLNHHFKTIAFTPKSSIPVTSKDEIKTSFSKLSYEKIEALIDK